LRLDEGQDAALPVVAAPSAPLPEAVPPA
jgi:hypothetical protein